MPDELGKLRRSTVVMTHAPGAVVDFRAGGAPVSAVVAGLEEWDRNFPKAGLLNSQRISEPRLEKKLNVKGFRLPPVIDEDWVDSNGRPDQRSLIAVRFPEWLQCPQCERIAPHWKWQRDPGRAYRYCPQCTARAPGRKKIHAIPVRFIMACEDGHLDDFPWHYWVGHKEDCPYHQGRHRGFLKLTNERPGLSGLFVSCPECGASHSLDGIFSGGTWAGFRCSGKRPWLASDNQACAKEPRAMQRGASNLYFPVMESALSIPPWSDRLQEALGIYWNSIIKTEPSDRPDFIRMLARGELEPALRELHLTPQEVARQVEERLSRYSDDAILGIRQEEYRQFVSGTDSKREDDREFEIRNIRIPGSIAPFFSHIVRVLRLREVRAVRGFTRINPPGSENDQTIAAISTGKTDWLPAIEVRGEGIFLEFTKIPVEQWEQRRELCDRAEKINGTWQKEWRRKFGPDSRPPFSITPRYLLIHTFAHALMRQLTLECGYSSAALRERLYISEGPEGMAGLLIYTSTSDSDGTLGGLQRQGEPVRIERAVRAAIKDMEWCSSDPLCIHDMIAAPETHLLAACHACCLAPETSCETYNRFLDRAMLVGLPERQDIGFFRSIIGD